MSKRPNNFSCTYCYRRRPRRFMKRDADCRDGGCTDQHWMCRSERDCCTAMKRLKVWP